MVVTQVVMVLVERPLLLRVPRVHVGIVVLKAQHQRVAREVLPVLIRGYVPVLQILCAVVSTGILRAIVLCVPVLMGVHGGMSPRLQIRHMHKPNVPIEELVIDLTVNVPV